MRYENQNFLIVTAVIGCREKGNELSLSESFKPVHYTFMCSYNQLKFVPLTKVRHPVRLQMQMQMQIQIVGY